MSFVRVKDTKTRHEFTAPARFVAGRDGLTVINKPAVDKNGRPLPAKPYTSVDKAAKQQTGQKAANKEEN